MQKYRKIMLNTFLILLTIFSAVSNAINEPSEFQWEGEPVVVCQADLEKLGTGWISRGKWVKRKFVIYVNGTMSIHDSQGAVKYTVPLRPEKIYTHDGKIKEKEYKIKFVKTKFDGRIFGIRLTDQNGFVHEISWGEEADYVYWLRQMAVLSEGWLIMG